MTKKQEEQIIQKRYLPAFRLVKISYVAMSKVKEVHDWTILQGMSEETADRIRDKAFTIFHKEVLNG